MDRFRYKRDRLYCEDVAVAEVARRVGTPFYLYSQLTLEEQFRIFDRAFASVPHLTCYAVKANSNLALIKLFHAMGAGFDIVSGGELLRVLEAGGDARKIVFSGVGKTEAEINLGLRKGILQFNVESKAELAIVEARARALRRKARVSLRVNPDVDPKTHPYISTGLLRHKFGMAMEEARELCAAYGKSRHIDIVGIGFHIGSQITRIDPFLDALQRVKQLARDLRAQGIAIRHLDLGGGLGITYNDEVPPRPEEYARAVLTAAEDLECVLFLEPGRVLVGNAGILVTRVLITKTNGATNFVVVDAGMTELLRPSLYGAYHSIRPERLGRQARWTTDVVGPVCESGDFLARGREMPVAKAGDLLAVMSTGAYGFVLSSNYNSRLRVPEVLVRGNRFKIIRRRETFSDMIRGETPSPILRIQAGEKAEPRRSSRRPQTDLRLSWTPSAKRRPTIFLMPHRTRKKKVL